MEKDVVHIYNGVLLSHIKEINNAIFSDMNGPRDCYTGWNVRHRKTNIWYHLYENMTQINIFIKQTQNHRCRPQTYDYLEGQVEEELTYTHYLSKIHN